MWTEQSLRNGLLSSFSKDSRSAAGECAGKHQKQAGWLYSGILSENLAGDRTAGPFGLYPRLRMNIALLPLTPGGLRMVSAKDGREPAASAASNVRGIKASCFVRLGGTCRRISRHAARRAAGAPASR